MSDENESMVDMRARQMAAADALAFGCAAPLPAAPAPTEREAFLAHLQSASDKAATWPSWKQLDAQAPTELAVELPPLPLGINESYFSDGTRMLSSCNAESPMFAAAQMLTFRAEGIAADRAARLAPDAGIDARDGERLDWLDKNIFHREMDDFDKRQYRGFTMWVTFAPNGTQGTARKIIDAAIDQEKAS